MAAAVNQRPGQCIVCGQTVHAGEGFTDRINNGWKLIHKECISKFQLAKKPTQEKK